ncbi:MAG TPA: c-type cytochrome [Sphingomicrobium sp.]|nr:c-type cytochrome [Sphingomicrobium sp.]
MADEPTAPDQQSPAGAPAEQAAVDRRWRLMASAAVGIFVVVGAVIGFVLIPAGQRENAHLSMGSAMRRAAGLEAGSPAQAQPAAATSAFPVSQVSWDPAIMKHLAGSNTDRGEKLAGEVCATCHGDKGLSQTAIIPSLAGQTSYAIYKQLHDYRSGARVNDQMTGVAKALAVEDLASIAAFYAAAGAQYAAIGNRDLSGEPEIIKLVWEGDTRRRIPACMSCHTNGVGGPIETPALLGQNREYMVAQLNAYADKSRKNDVYGRMRDIARRLTPEEREKLARYLQGTL